MTIFQILKRISIISNYDIFILYHNWYNFQIVHTLPFAVKYLNICSKVSVIVVTTFLIINAWMCPFLGSWNLRNCKLNQNYWNNFSSKNQKSLPWTCIRPGNIPHNLLIEEKKPCCYVMIISHPLFCNYVVDHVCETKEQ